MAMIDRIKFDGPADLLVWKYPKDNIVLGSQLIVNQSQEAIFYKDGRALDVLGPGNHTIIANNIPILQKLINLPFGGETPFAAEVFIINKVSKLDYKWGTRSPIPVEDPKYKVMMSVGAFGQFGLRIADSRLFVTEIVGTMPVWDSSKITEYFRGLIVSQIKTSIAKFIVRKNISIVEITAYLDELSKMAEEPIQEEFHRFGLELLNFYVSSTSIPDEETKKIQKGQFERLQMDQLGDERYARMRSLDVLETAASNPGAPGTLMAGGLGLGMGMQMMQQAGQMTQNSAAPTQAPTMQTGAGNSIGSNSLLCPSCKAQIPAGGKYCGQCGAEAMPVIRCPKCSKETIPGAKFCGECGCALGARTCPQCASEVGLDAKFCNSCGKNLGA